MINNAKEKCGKKAACLGLILIRDLKKEEKKTLIKFMNYIK